MLKRAAALMVTILVLVAGGLLAGLTHTRTGLKLMMEGIVATGNKSVATGDPAIKTLAPGNGVLERKAGEIVPHAVDVARDAAEIYLRDAEGRRHGSNGRGK